MIDDINAVDKVEPADDLVSKAGRYGAFGWIAFFVTLFGLILQNIVYALKPPIVMGAENGQVIGQVVFDEPTMRDKDIISGDLKTWVGSCVSVNKNRIIEDLSICLKHFTDEKAEERLEGYKKINYAQQVKNFGCERTDTVFYDTQNTIKRDKTGRWIEANIAGDVICDPHKNDPDHQEFKLKITAELKYKSATNTLGFKVHNIEDIE